MAKETAVSEDPCPKCGKSPCVCETEDKGSKVCDKCEKPMDGDKCSDASCTGTKAPKAKKAMADGATMHADYWGPLNDHVRRTKPMKETAAGFYEGSAAVTCVGVFRYLMPDGTVQNRFRPPEEVFNEESLESLELATLTNGHPAKGVSPENYSSVVVGSLGDEIENDAYNVYADITIKDAKAIADTKAGKTGLSCGYSALLVTEGEVSYPVTEWQEDPVDKQWKEMEIGRTVYKVPGVWGGIPYDAIQTQIDYNHVALVDVPRGGDALHLQFDGAEQYGILVQRTDGNQADGHQHSEQERNHMKKIHLDGQEAEFEVPEAVAKHIDGLSAKVAGIAKLEADKADAEAKLAAANSALAAVQKDAEDLKASIPSKIHDGVASRLALVAKAGTLGVVAKAEDSEDAIRKEVIKAAMPEVPTDSMDAVALEAHFNAACSVLTSRHNDAAIHQRKSVADGATAPEVQADGVTWENAHERGGVK